MSSSELCESFITFNGDPVLNLLDTVTFMRYFSSLSGIKLGHGFVEIARRRIIVRNIRKVSE